MTYGDAVQSWRDFYVTAGAAAATLVGLLFVGLSLHIRVVVSQADVKSLARITLADFFVILLVALVILAPRPANVLSVFPRVSPAGDRPQQDAYGLWQTRFYRGANRPAAP